MGKIRAKEQKLFRKGLYDVGRRKEITSSVIAFVCSSRILSLFSVFVSV